MQIFEGSVVAAIIDYNIDKMVGYLTFNAYGEVDWSAMDRNEHLENAFNYFMDSNFVELLFGHGTGAYSFYAAHHSDVKVENVEEAYNLYLSTLTDRGLIGLFVLLAIYYNIYKIKTKDIVSDSIWMALVVQLIHYFLVGNMWLYYVWQEVVMLICYERYKYISSCKNLKHN